VFEGKPSRIGISFGDELGASASSRCSTLDVWAKCALAGGWARWLSVAAVVVAVGLLAAPGTALAQGSGYFVTFAARSCPSYGDIDANKARNDIQESLDDLGPDSPYNSNGGLVNPTVEEAAPQDVCSPLPDWTFTMGTGEQQGASTGPWGSLSIVTNPFGTSIVTQVSTPLYDQYHSLVPGSSLPGATTIELTDAEVSAANGGALWAQGGTPEDPVLAKQYPGPQYGFGALRCSDDALNGDNVEHVDFPAGVTHVFCYALYVVPPPTSGTITIQKRVVGAPGGAAPSFAFNGSISYDPNGFTLSDGQSKDFYRAGGQTWIVNEGAVDSYKLSSVDCTAVTASGAAGSSTFTVSGATTSINLVANEHVTCVYTNTYQPPVGGLTIAKITRGGTGRFKYTIAPAGGGSAHQSTATTTTTGVPATAQPTLSNLAPGRYTITEHAPSSTQGRWHSVSVACDGTKHRPGQPVTVTVSSGQTTACTFVNAFVPAASLSLATITLGSTGTAQFLITPKLRAVQYHQSTTTTRQGVAVDATANNRPDSTGHLPFGLYVMRQQAPLGVLHGHWTLVAVRCNGRFVPFSRGVAKIALTLKHPVEHCVFIDLFVHQPAPPPPPPPTPPAPPSPPGPTPPAPDVYPMTDLSVTKHALKSVVAEGAPVTFRIAVHNNGPDPAANVVLADKPQEQAKIVYVHPSTGQCTIGQLVICRLGNLAPGATATIMVQLIPETTDPDFTNRAVIGSGTTEATLANNLSQATIRIVAPSNPVACPSRVSPTAHPAC